MVVGVSGEKKILGRVTSIQGDDKKGRQYFGRQIGHIGRKLAASSQKFHIRPWCLWGQGKR